MSIRQAISEELHRQVRRNFPTRNVELKGVNDLYQADLVEMIPFSTLNKGYRYIMTIINCFSKFAYAIPLKTKSAKDVVNALAPVLRANKMKHFQTDKGTEWYNERVQELLSSFNINHYSTFSEKKATIIERFNRTLKNYMWKWFTANGKYTWLEILPVLVNRYNNTVHRTIRMKPVDVNTRNEKKILQQISKNKFPIRPAKFKVGDRVRISKYKKVFAKGYLPNWTNEIFTVYSVKPTAPRTYILKDDKGNVLHGGFYEQELNKSKYDNIFLIEKILKRSGDKLFVKWLGYDKSYNSWIDKKQVV